MFVVSPSTLWNHAALETRAVPKRMLGRIAVIPRRGTAPRLWPRLLFEMQMLRYLLPLVPFVVAMILWPHLALPISQAPIPMMMVIALVEMKVLAVTPDARKRLISEDDAARGLDALRFNGTRVLTRIAALREMQQGELTLVVEQSELARVPPLTLVSLQQPLPSPEVLDLTPQERAMLQSELFDDEFSEGQLHKITLRDGVNLHSVTLDVGTISAHARMAALMDASGEAAQ